MKRKIMKRLVSMLLAIAMTIGCIPLSTASVLAAPASDIPAKMLNNHMLDALEYIGYKVQAQRDDGTLYKKIGGEATAYLSKVTYGQDSTAGNGLEVNSYGKPDIAYFEKYGMQCGSWASYYWFNYLPHVAGVDTSYLNPPTWPMNPGSWWERAQDWIKAGYAEEISFTVDWNTGKVVPAKEIPIGSIVLFANRETGSLWTGGHVSMYAGEYNGTQYLTHVGTSRGPEFHSINAFHLNQADKGGTKQVVSKIIAIKDIESPYGYIEVNKKDQSGKNLSGAEFSVTNKSTGKIVKKQTTDANGYVMFDRLQYGTYTVTETKFPTGYTSSGTTTWTVTISDSNKGKVVINAVNEPDTGKCKIVRTSEDNKISGVSFNTAYCYVVPAKQNVSLRGFARVCFDECFVVSNITLVQGKEDIFVSMPNYRTEQHDENGKPVYRDICYPITKDFREKLYGAVYNGFIEALEAKKEQAEPAEKAKKDKPEKAEKEESEKTPTRKSKSK